MFQSVRVSKRGEPDAVVVGVFSSNQGPTPLDAKTKALKAAKAIKNIHKLPECTGKAGSLAEGFEGKTRVIVLGLGARKEFGAVSLRTSFAAALRRLAVVRAKHACIELAGPCASAKVDGRSAGISAGIAAGLLCFDTAAFKGASAKNNNKKTKLQLCSSDSMFEKGMSHGVSLGASANLCRTWANTPPNIATPAWMAAQARAVARGVDTLSVRVVKGAELEKEKMIGLINVGKASENPPCLIRIAYTPKGAKKGMAPAVLVGKTMTYDTGGLSIKTGGSMKGMKEDKDGGCAALAAMHAIATVVKPRRPVVCILVSAENSISNNAYRPDDVLTFRNGVTVEVTNTDAEGRLVLADGLCWSKDREKPAFIVDLATLTGGVITALGSTFAGLWCDDDALRARFDTASADSGERVWRLPHHQEYRDMMKSPVADILNSNPNRKAHPIQGAAFLSYFVDEKTPWCHLDIAGVHAAQSDTGPYAGNMPTGWGVLLLASLFEQE